jgi:hypothetical protein
MKTKVFNTKNKYWTYCQVDVILFVNFAEKEKGKQREIKSGRQVHVGTL